MMTQRKMNRRNRKFQTQMIEGKLNKLYREEDDLELVLYTMSDLRGNVTDKKNIKRCDALKVKMDINHAKSMALYTRLTKVKLSDKERAAAGLRVNYGQTFTNEEMLEHQMSYGLNR